MDRRNLHIETLRAAAILFVLLSHFPINESVWPFDLPDYVELWAGVDLFFVISGYLITRSLSGLMRARAQGEAWWPELKAFWVRRAFRLLPAAWLWLLVPVLLSIFIGQNPLFASTRTLINDSFAAVFQVANIYWATCISSGLWGQLCSKAPGVGAYWSLSLEEQFYVLLPIILILLPKRFLLPSLLLLISAHLFWIRPIFTMGWYIRPDGLLWGVVLALLSMQPPRFDLASKLIRLRLGGALSIALLLLLAWLPTQGAQAVPGISTVAMVAVTGAALVWLAAHGVGLRAGAFLQWMGSRSYAIYLVHFPLYYLMLILLFPAGYGLLQSWKDILIYALCTAGIVGLAAELTYRYVEVPIRDYGRQLASRMPRERNTQEAII